MADFDMMQVRGLKMKDLRGLFSRHDLWERRLVPFRD